MCPPGGPGDEVILIGRSGGEEIRAEDLARQCGTITNELLSRLGARLPGVPPGRLKHEAQPGAARKILES